ncbi:MAG: hypothetical protein R2873_35550 [Caldilineaceae bacterium]
MTPSPIVELNRAVALGMAYGPEVGLALVDQLNADPTLADYHLLPSVRGSACQVGAGGRSGDGVQAGCRTHAE